MFALEGVYRFVPFVPATDAAFWYLPIAAEAQVSIVGVTNERTPIC